MPMSPDPGDAFGLPEGQNPGPPPHPTCTDAIKETAHQDNFKRPGHLTGTNKKSSHNYNKITANQSFLSEINHNQVLDSSHMCISHY